MLVRVVRMTFREEHVPAFLAIFEESHVHIRQFPGCLHLELLWDVQQLNVFCTYSHWTDEAALERYRQSALFTGTWARTRLLFAERPQAYSLQRVMVAEK